MQIKIACPACEWEPDGGPHWCCTCGHEWNTFETSGKCPACSKTWEDTQCPGPGGPGGCGTWAKHNDWYRNLDTALKLALDKTSVAQLNDI